MVCGVSCLQIRRGLRGKGGVESRTVEGLSLGAGKRASKSRGGEAEDGEEEGGLHCERCSFRFCVVRCVLVAVLELERS